MSTSGNINVVDLIVRKREKGELSPLEITSLVNGYTLGDIPDYQMAAFLMAAFLNGMNEGEMVALTEAMLHSGSVLDLSDIPGKKVDKHSTGGVGDKVSIPLAAIVAACGVGVPMISGRGLGHTGGTLDKLESIPGFSTQMDMGAFRRQLADIGVVMIGQTDEIAPADKKLYALRDVTGTVEFIPFIAASILSKKIAEGIDALVLDVKCGSGAFMQSETDARQLAETLVQIGERFDKPAVALLTDMDQPLGRRVGNWPEIAESVHCLRGDGPEDLMEVTLALAAEMLVAGGVAESLEEGQEMSEQCINDGRAMEKFVRLVESQGGDPDAVRNPEKIDGQAHVADIRAPENSAGTVARIDARIIGRAMITLGAGRRTKEDEVDPLAGITLTVKQGERVPPSGVIARIQASSGDWFAATSEMVTSAFEFAETVSDPGSRLIDRYSNGCWVNP